MPSRREHRGARGTERLGPLLLLAALVGGGAGAESQAPDETAPAPLLLPRGALPLEWIRALGHATMTFSASRIEYRDIVLENVALPLRIEQGRLQIAGAQARLAGGLLSGSITIESAQPGLAVALAGRQIEVGDLPWFERLIKGARADISMELAGRGDSLDAVLRSAQGTLSMEATGGTLDNTALDRAGRDFISMLLGMVNPFAGTDRSNTLECAVALFEIDAGRAVSDGAIGLETATVEVRGGGVVDLGSEALDLELRPRPKEGIRLSAGLLSGPIAIGGSLAEPRPRVRAENLVPRGVLLGPEVAGAGLDTLTGLLFDSGLSGAGPCARAAAGASAPPPGVQRR
jgi:uncharacterized protein involved in outer membrane biogenesis